MCANKKIKDIVCMIMILSASANYASAPAQPGQQERKIKKISSKEIAHIKSRTKKQTKQSVPRLSKDEQAKLKTCMQGRITPAAAPEQLPSQAPATARNTTPPPIIAQQTHQLLKPELRNKVSPEEVLAIIESYKEANIEDYGH